MGPTNSSLRSSSMDPADTDTGPAELDAQLLHSRQCLVSAIKHASDCSNPLMDLVYLKCPVAMKYAVLNVTKILQENNQTIQNLKNIPVALNILEKYGRHLLKPKSLRNELWRYVKFSNPIFKDRVDALRGGRELMRLMGYTQEIEDGLFFPEPEEPNLDQTANMVADIILAKKQMEMYLSGVHPNQTEVEQFIPPNVVSDVEMLRVGVSISALGQHSPPGPTTGGQTLMPQAEGGGQDLATSVSLQKLCDICGDQEATKLCSSCDYKLLCAQCDDMWHKHPRRQNHQRDLTSPSKSKENPLQASATIQGPYGIQARPTHSRIPSPTYNAVQPGRNKSDLDSSATDKTEQPAGQNPSSMLQNILNLDSILTPKSSSCAYGQLEESCTAAAPLEVPQMKEHPPIPDRKLKPMLVSQTLVSGKQQLLQESEPVHVFLPSENISSSPLNLSMPRQSARMSEIDQSALTSKLLPKIKEESNLEKQKAKCEIHIISLTEEIEEIEVQLNHLIEMNGKFYEQDEFLALNKKKGLLKREKLILEKHRSRLESNSDKHSQVSSDVYYPPSHVDFSRLDNNTLTTSSVNKPVCVYQAQHTGRTHNTSVASQVGTKVVSNVDENMHQSSVIQPGKIQQPQVLQDSQVVSTETASLVVVQKNQQSSPSIKPEAEENIETITNNSKETVACRSNSNRQPDHGSQWQCEHCTMFNDSNTRICDMCHRTSDNPVFVHDICPTEEIKETEETFVVSPNIPMVGTKIAQEQDQVYLEKQEAHRRYEEKLLLGAMGKQVSESTKQSTNSSMNSSQTGMLGNNVSLQASDYQKSAINDCVNQNQSHPIHEEVSSEHSFQSRQSTFQETMENINEQRHMKKTQLDGADLLQMIKLADQKGYGVEEVHIALEQCGKDTKVVIDWLKKIWEKCIDDVISRVAHASQASQQNDIGVISTVEAKRALQESSGSVENAVMYCINTRTKLYTDVNRETLYAREDVLEAMHEHEGNKEHVIHHLDMMRLAPFKHRIWVGSDNPEPDMMQLALNINCNSVSTSVISHEDFQDMVCNKDIDLERRIRTVLVEARLQSWGRAETVVKILDNDLETLKQESDYEYTLEDVVEAVRNCQDRRSSIVYLQRECVICMSRFPMSKMMNLNICQCQMCRECLSRHFEISIKEKHVRNWTCPVCSLPDFNDENVSDYLNLLGLMLNTFVEKDIQDLFETKVRDWHLQNDPKFRWCAHCGNGFLYQGWQNGRGQLSMTCQQCFKKTCFLCKKQWEDQHEGLTCEEFTQWKFDNDPENQAVGLAKVLEESGIDCPSCKMRYSLAKGGCMHFKCPECAHEFCSGCSQPFYKQGTCMKFTQCVTQGLHCHHPRDCFFYLRDNDIVELQRLLQIGHVQFNTEGPGQTLRACPVMEQKDGEVGSRQDEACGKEVMEGNAGLCSVHYKEYLVGLINRHKLDPVNIMSSEQMHRLISRTEIAEQKKNDTETQIQFNNRLTTFIKQKIPLKR
ncbi:E3 ubiquitin-protein ligase RNF31-like isoform X1 [Haliotis cracherodii]|uniref:E3 ubiquitin-protein ligase RNF31-like isoform X1 n=1 Tax=Haliotis cracherodii TaxID=6455 RepID=UPI0039E9B3BC